METKMLQCVGDCGTNGPMISSWLKELRMEMEMDSSRMQTIVFLSKNKKICTKNWNQKGRTGGKKRKKEKEKLTFGDWRFEIPKCNAKRGLKSKQSFSFFLSPGPRVRLFLQPPLCFSLLSLFLSLCLLIEAGACSKYCSSNFSHFAFSPPQVSLISKKKKKNEYPFFPKLHFMHVYQSRQ